ncbi:MAG: phage major capsid protein [Gammaproteobacteria bacterium]
MRRETSALLERIDPDRSTPRCRELAGEIKTLAREAECIAELAEQANRDLTAIELTRIGELSHKSELVEARLEEVGSQSMGRVAEPNPIAGTPFLRGRSPNATPGKLKAAAGQWRDAKSGEPIRLVGPGEALSAESQYGEGEERFERLLEGLVKGDRNLAPAEAKMLSQSNIDTAGQFAVPEFFSSQIIDAARAASVAFQYCTVLPMGGGDVRIARIDTDPVAQWTGERVARTDDSPIFGQSVLRSRTLRTFIPISEELLEDAPNVQTAISQAIAAAFALATDKAIISGTSDGDGISPVGLRAISGTNPDTSVGTPNFDDFSNAYTTCLTANAPEPFFVLAHPRTYKTLDQIKTASTLEYLNRPESWGNMTKLRTTSISIVEGAGSNESFAIVGPLPTVIVGIRSQLNIQISRDLDQAAKYERSIVAAMRMDIVIPRPAFFTLLTGIL